MKPTFTPTRIATLADLVLSAQAAANKAVTAPDQLARETIRHEEFTAAGFDRGDYLTWKNAFNAQLDMLTMFATQDSPATQAAKKAAAAAGQQLG